MSNVKAMQQTFKQEAAKLCADLRGLADEIRLKGHLASADARDAWAKVEPQLQQFERRVEHATESVIGELRQASKELKANLEHIREDQHRD